MKGSSGSGGGAGTPGITPPEVFFSRRRLLRGAVALAAGVGTGLTLESCRHGEPEAAVPALERPDVFPPPRNPAFAVPAGLDPALTPRSIAASHNNFYEFLPGRAGAVFRHTAAFEVEPWQVEIRGECHRPGLWDLDDLFSFPHEERIYHFRCVERWAMNVPWSGFPLRLLLARVEPTSRARFVRFSSARRREQMPGLAATPHYPWPYHEALRLDEAMCDLALVATGVYGEPLPKQHGAPVRIVVPWKYGYKSPKSVVRIELLPEQPRTFWQEVAPHEYGFLSNVNPNIPHPRWSQEASFWLDEGLAWPTALHRFLTPLFNGYAEQVADLYPDEPRTLQRPLVPGEIAR